MVKSKLLKSKSGRICQLSGKKATKGWKYSFLRSHYNPTTKRLKGKQKKELMVSLGLAEEV